MIYRSFIVQCKHRKGLSWFTTLNVTVLYLILDFTLGPSSDQRLTHLEFTTIGGLVQRSVATLDAHARNNSTGKSSQWVLLQNTITTVDQSKTIQSGIQQLVDMVLLVWYLHCMIAISVQTYMYTYTSVIEPQSYGHFRLPDTLWLSFSGNVTTLLAIFLEKVTTYAILSMAIPRQNVCDSG